MTATPQTRPAVFLDRDGTIVQEVDHLHRVEDIKLFEFTEEALSSLKENNFLVIVVTNQSGIARGYFDESAMHSIHKELDRRYSGLIDGFYFCPHGPDDGCDCRKPNVGMIRQAMSEFSVDLANSWMVGDKKSDIETGFAAGLSTALVLTGYGQTDLASLDRMPDIVASDLLEASRQIRSRDE